MTYVGLVYGALLGLGGFGRLGSLCAHILLLSVVFTLDHPFGNQRGVTSDPFEQSLSAFDSVDRGT